MARGSQHLKKRPAGEPQRPPRVESARAQQRRERQAAEAGMFFPKLRTHARWMFVVLALMMGGGFVLFGVGSGSSGIGNVLTDWLNIGQTTTGPSISSLEERTRENPADANAWRELATAYAADQRTDDAVRALERLAALRPRDANVLQELSGQYQRQLQNLNVEAQTIHASSPTVDPTLLRPAPTTAFGRAYTDPSALQDPLTQALTSDVNERIAELQIEGREIEQDILATSKKVAQLDPNDPTAQFQLGQVADATGDTATATAAYRRFLRLSPEDPLAAQVRARLAQLAPPAKASSG